ncbi:DUF4235 domain-containing protein [Rothia halotolerans]|uniref:DUF4235 domain-containing protein n=1 Tax=Rothia halotolerans TaxID=405770 RepID=UPI00101D27BA|nr:DUF4235 domain-containing protein [Rothia halotolerans]
MSKNSSTSTSAKILYRPLGMAGSLVSGAVAGVVFKQVWKLVSPQKSGDDAPKALESEFNLGEVLAAAALQGAIFALVKALVDRGGARAFQRVMGEWPGD